MVRTIHYSLILIFCFANHSWGQQMDDAIAGDAPPNEAKLVSGFKYQGSVECTVCHVSPGVKYSLDDVTDFVYLNEYEIWISQDPHSKSYLKIIPDQSHFAVASARRSSLVNAVNRAGCGGNLDLLPKPSEPIRWGASNELSLEILRKIIGSHHELEIAKLFRRLTTEPDVLTREDELEQFSPRLVSTVKQCISCHAGWDLRQPDFDYESVKYGTGVSCEACHGSSSGWIDAHKNTEWRKLAPSDKAEKYGMCNTRQPVSKSQLCFSCHIGDIKQGKFVTHEMYAAGHPPLPSVEIESFADQIPRHWRHLNEKKRFAFAEDFAARFTEDLGIAAETPIQYDFHRTKSVLVGGILAAAESTKLLSDSADVYLKSHSANSKFEVDLTLAWPDYATFDCVACHHDLKNNDSIERTFKGTPGRPPEHSWPQPMAKLATAYLALQQKVDFVSDNRASLDDLQKVLDLQPFGVPDRLLDAGQRRVALLHEIAQTIQAEPLTRQDAIYILQLMCGNCENSIFNPETERWDFHSARQLVWSINLVYSDIEQQLNVGSQRLSNRFEPANKQAADVIAELKQYLRWNLDKPGAITLNQPEYLSQWYDFESEKFILMLKRLSTALQNEDFLSRDQPLEELSLK